MANWKSKKARYGTRFYDMLKRGCSVGKVKRAMYDDHDEHKRLRLTEQTLDQIWESLMEGTFVPKRKQKEPSRHAHSIVRVNPKNGRVMEEYKDKTEASEKLGYPESTIYAIISGRAKKDYLKLKYKEELR